MRAEPQSPPSPPDPSQPFTRKAALAAGIRPRQLSGAGFQEVLRGVYLGAGRKIDPVMRARAALELFDPSAFASHASAARVWAADDPGRARRGHEAKHRRRPADVVCHLRAEADVVTRHGVRVSSPAQMFVELAELLHLVDLVVVGDDLVRRRLVGCDALAAHTAGSSAPGARLARRAASYVRARVDSPMESRLRMLLVLAGIPEPEVNLTIRDADGEPLRRYDLSWPAAKTAGEYDGRQHAERIEQWEADLERREAIDDDEWRLLVVVASGIYHHPERTVWRVWRTLRARGLPGLPARPSEDWRPYFPSRD